MSCNVTKQPHLIAQQHMVMLRLCLFVFFATLGVNQTLKRKSGNKVTPNMSLLKSMTTQDSQQQARMDRNRRRTFENYQEKKAWARMSPTARWVTQTCESQIQQNVEAAFNNCLVLPDGGHEVLLLRKPEDGKKHCCKLCTRERTCSSCSYFSPIVKTQEDHLHGALQCKWKAHWTLVRSQVQLSLLWNVWDSLPSFLCPHPATTPSCQCEMEPSLQSLLEKEWFQSPHAKIPCQTVQQQTDCYHSRVPIHDGCCR